MDPMGVGWLVIRNYDIYIYIIHDRFSHDFELRHRMRNVMHRCERWAEKEKLKTGNSGNMGCHPKKTAVYTLVCNMCILFQSLCFIHENGIVTGIVLLKRVVSETTN